MQDITVLWHIHEDISRFSGMSAHNPALFLGLSSGLCSESAKEQELLTHKDDYGLIQFCPATDSALWAGMKEQSEGHVMI